MHHHVKSERDKDVDDDDLDDDRKPDMVHGHHGYYQHPMTMGGHYHHHNMKTEMDTVSKNQTGSDCGVPIPASKPKIWSLADTAACKTPPPHSHLHLNAAGAWAYQTHQSAQYNNSSHTGSPTHNNHLHQMQQLQQQPQHQQLAQQQQQQHQIQQDQIPQQHMMNMQGNTSVPGGMNMNAITSGHHNNQSQPPMSTNGMNTWGGNSPYSRYGGFLAGAQAATHPTQHPQQPHQTQQHHQYINNNHTGGTTTPVTPNSTGQAITPTLQQNSNSQTSSNQTMGFPEVQTGNKQSQKFINSSFYYYFYYYPFFCLL